MNQAEKFIQQKLAQRLQDDNFRVLKTASGLIDFCSNDYLGFARSEKLKALVQAEIKKYPAYLNGSGGSRLLSGNTAFTEELEQQIATIHQAEAGLIFNSGYDANLGLFSCLPQKGDTIITDELIHACIIDGARLSYANRFSFKHNDLDDLEKKLKNVKGICYVAVESVYSMDGDTAPLKEMSQLTAKYNANLIVDEAHATGVFGKGLVQQLQLEKQIFARTVTFGKALGSHGAIVLGSKNLRNYLINFARSFIYTTAPSFHQLLTTQMAYQLLENSAEEQNQLLLLIGLFKKEVQKKQANSLIASNSAIQSVLAPGNAHAKQIAEYLQKNGFDVRAILSPTVPAGMERLRICIHAYNSTEEITKLAALINGNEQ
ncbi:aminotransferase class I/II-fold pyridoxal phosphate-dependent enzyme [Mucilaginibacter arboris]|uniref:Aminotransferase class I/II-fold pyridoxal phosphate-dependent enzyme n=1 Tax=Mucilaginibacter arboris TaxID=2682090 RepID=A0A7K1SYK1_9SPHI|nr:8-amino-7-oxononanoate synthase [Mucilaginibacter arboris]MVN22404.1 aminotransferase class I/II-fold pyridoxal phosphate-dependent enzyme [Mucilaginibacter arboris]